MRRELCPLASDRLSNRAKEGFSLVEVVLAIGVASFCLIAVLGLLPVGLKANKDSSNQTTAAGLAMAIASDLRATPATNTTSTTYGLIIPSPASGVTPITRTLYLSEDGSMTDTPLNLNSRYRATVTITPPSTGMKSATAARILVTWPASAEPAKASCFESLIYLDRN